MCLVLFCVFFLSLSPFLSISCSIAPKCKSTPSRNPLRFKASFSSPLLILHPPMSSSVMIKPIRTFQRTFHDVAFIQNAKSFYWTFSILTFPLSSIVRVGSHCVAFDHLSLRDHTRVLLQYAQIWLFCTSFYHSHSRYAHCSHSGSYIRSATRTEGRVCWLPWLWAS